MADSKEGNSLGDVAQLVELEEDARLIILVLILEVIRLALEEGKLPEELTRIISGILRYLRIIGDPSLQQRTQR